MLLLLVLKYDRGDHVVREGRKEGHDERSSKLPSLSVFSNVEN